MKRYSLVWEAPEPGRRRVTALLLGIAALAALGWSWVAASPASAAIPQYDVFGLGSPQPQSELGSGPTPSPTGSAFGERIWSLGDVDGDGARDLLVTNTHYDRNGIVDVGRVWIFSGRTRALLLTINHPAPQALSQFGFWAARLGDVNGNGYPDFVVSAPNQVVGGVKQGQVYVFDGHTGALLRTIDQPDAPQLNGDFGGTRLSHFLMA